MLTQPETEVLHAPCTNPDFVATGIHDITNQGAPLPPSFRHQAAAQGFSQMFGLHIYAATLTILVDIMVFTSDVISLGLLLPVTIGAAGVLSYIVYLIQRRFYGDDHEAALVKCLTVGLLTAIPAPLAPLITIPSGIIGAVNLVRRKKN